MTRNQYRAAIARVGLSQVGAARFFGGAGAIGGPSPAGARVGGLMIALDLSAEEAAKFLSRG
jgi:hypothetical protein